MKTSLADLTHRWSSILQFPGSPSMTIVSSPRYLGGSIRLYGPMLSLYEMVKTLFVPPLASAVASCVFAT